MLPAKTSHTLAAQNAAHRIQKEDKWWDMCEKCCAQFPRLDAETRTWFNYNCKGKAFEHLPLDQKMAIHQMKKRLQREFGGRLPLIGCAMGNPEVPGAKPAKKKMGGLPKPPADILEIAKADASTQNFKVVKFWSDLLVDYSKFEKDNGAPSGRSESNNEKRLAHGYAYCHALAKQGKLPLEIEILYSYMNRAFDPVWVWKQKLARHARTLSETGAPPPFSSRHQRHLAHWYYIVSNLHTRGVLPEGSEWLATNFKPISELNGYLALAHIICEENITSDSPVADARKWAAWRDDIRKLHAEGRLSPDVVQHFSKFSRMLEA